MKSKQRDGSLRGVLLFFNISLSIFIEFYRDVTAVLKCDLWLDTSGVLFAYLNLNQHLVFHKVAPHARALIRQAYKLSTV